MWPKVKQIGGEDGRSKETQENKTAHCCEADVRIHYTEITNKDFITSVLNLTQISLQVIHLISNLDLCTRAAVAQIQQMGAA